MKGLERAIERKRGHLALLVACMLLATVSAGWAAGGAEQASAAGQPQEFRVLYTAHPNYDASTVWLHEKWMADKLNVKIVKSVVPSEGYEEKRNLMLATGELDMTSDPADKFFQQVLSGNVMKLTPFMGKMPDYQGILNDDMKRRTTYKGDFYGVMRLMHNYAPGRDTVNSPISHMRLLVRKDWLEKVGMQAPTTLDGVYKVAKEFLAKNPGNVKNLYLFTGQGGARALDQFDFVFGAFGSAYDAWYEDNGQVLPWAIHPNTRAALEWLRKAYAENLIDKDFVVQQFDQWKTKVVLGQTGFYFGHWWNIFMEGWGFQMEANVLGNPNHKYDKQKPFLFWTPLAAPAGPAGDKGYPSGLASADDPMYWIPANAKNWEATLKVWNYLSTIEGMMTCDYGIPDRQYTWNGGADRPKAGPEVGTQDWGTYRVKMGVDAGEFGMMPLNRTLSYKYEWATWYGYYEPDSDWYGFGQIFNIDGCFADFGGPNPKYVNIVKDRSLYSKSAPQIRTQLETMRNEYFVGIITGQYGMDKWDEFVKRWQSEGGTTLSTEYSQSLKDRK